MNQNQPLPNVVDLERALLGRILLNPELADSLELSASAFYIAPHRTIWATIRTMRSEGIPVELATIRHRIDSSPDPALSIAPLLSSLTDNPATAAALDYYAEKIRDAALRREALRFLASAEEQATSDRPIEELSPLLDAIRDGISANSPHVLAAISPADAMTAQPADVPWIVRGWLAEAEFALLAGEWGTGKSWLAMSLAVAIASGRSWLGCAPILGGPRRVLYVDEENGPPLAATRLRQILVGAELPDPAALPIRYLTRNGLVLDQPGGIAALIQEIRTFKPAVVFLDSLIRFHGADENSASEMAAFFARAIRPLTGRYGCSVVALDHMRKPSRQEAGSAGHRIRGSSDKAGAVDEIYLLQGDRKTRDRTVTHEKTRWDEPMPDLAITWAKSDDGEAVTIAGRHAEQSGDDRLAGLLVSAGATGMTYTDLSQALERAGVADRTAKYSIGKAHAIGSIKRRREGRFVRYWLPEFAPLDAD